LWASPHWVVYQSAPVHRIPTDNTYSSMSNSFSQVHAESNHLCHWARCPCLKGKAGGLACLELLEGFQV